MMNAKRGPRQQGYLSESCPSVALFPESVPAQFSLANAFMAAGAATLADHRASVLGNSALPAGFQAPAERFLA